MTLAIIKKMRRLAQGLTAEGLRALAIERKMPEAASRQLLGLIDALIADHLDALLTASSNGLTKWRRRSQSKVAKPTSYGARHAPS